MLRRAAISCGVLLALLTAAPHVFGRTRPSYGGTLHVEIAGDPWQHGTGIARRMVMDGLTDFDAAGMLQSALAVNWKSDNNNHRWQFQLRPGVVFQDGTPLSAANVVAALNADCDGHCPWTAVRAVASSVVFTGEAAMPNLPALLASDEFLIALTVKPDGSTPGGNIGTGPFRLTGFTNGVLQLGANENCWRGRPFVDAVEIRVHRAVRDQWLDLSVGRADVVEIPPEMLRQALQQRLNVVAVQEAQLLELHADGTGALANPMLRGAIANAVDRAALADVIFQKQAEATASLLPENVSGYAFLFPTGRNMDEAHRIRGGLNAPPLLLSSDGGAAMQLAAQRIALNLKEAGFNVQTTAAASRHADLELHALPMESRNPADLLVLLIRASGEAAPQELSFASITGLYKTERDFLASHSVIPLLDLPRAYATGPRVRELKLGVDGAPDIAEASLEDAP
ncbi:MAG TPA: ABC transporter substrate-binding protein [Terracidiphilus sp.]|nr:ABC transporter substrate-binding protein [Terracidiphilus sp.]